LLKKGVRSCRSDRHATVSQTGAEEVLTGFVVDVLHPTLSVDDEGATFDHRLARLAGGVEQNHLLAHGLFASQLVSGSVSFVLGQRLMNIVWQVEGLECFGEALFHAITSDVHRDEGLGCQPEALELTLNPNRFRLVPHDPTWSIEMCEGVQILKGRGHQPEG
jgi:hypothetical protein